MSAEAHQKVRASTTATPTGARERGQGPDTGSDEKADIRKDSEVRIAPLCAGTGRAHATNAHSSAMTK